VRSDDAGTPRSILPALHCAQLWQDFNLGRSEAAETGAQALVELGQQFGNSMYVLEAVIVQISLALLRGDTRAAAARLAHADQLTDADDDVRRPRLSVMRGWLAACQGDFPSALKLLEPVAWGATSMFNYWPVSPCWTGLFFDIAADGADDAFAEVVVQIAELAAVRNPGVASFEGMALNVRGRSKGDLAMIADAADVLARRPRPILRAFGADGYGRALLADGQRAAALEQLDRAWEDYHRMDARVYRADVQRVLRETGVRRAKWSATATRPDTGWASLTDAERRVALLIAEGHTNRSAAAELGVSINTVGTHLRLAFAKLGVQSRVQLANLVRRAER
jgi:DNA-binding CsgD family transcriptional regulator